MKKFLLGLIAVAAVFLQLSQNAQARVLRAGQSFQVNTPLYSNDGVFRVVLQSDGNLVVYDDQNKALWASGTNGKAVSRCIMQTDGNLVIYGYNNAIWASNTNGNRGAYLSMQDDGNLVIYLPGGRPIWATNTNVL
jgi:hypothetical protein